MSINVKVSRQEHDVRTVTLGSNKLNSNKKIKDTEPLSTKVAEGLYEKYGKKNV